MNLNTNLSFNLSSIDPKIFKKALRVLGRFQSLIAILILVAVTAFTAQQLGLAIGAVPTEDELKAAQEANDVNVPSINAKAVETLKGQVPVDGSYNPGPIGRPSPF